MDNSLSISAQSELIRPKQLYLMSENYLFLVRKGGGCLLTLIFVLD